MDRHRSYPDEPQSRWYGDDPTRAEDWDRGDEERYPSGEYRVPVPRPADPVPDLRYPDLPDPGGLPQFGGGATPARDPLGAQDMSNTDTLGGGSAGGYPYSASQLVGPPAAHAAAGGAYPDAPPVSGGEPPRYHAEAIDRSALRRPAGPAAPVGDGVYRTRRPAMAAIFAVAVLLLELPAFRVLASAAFAKQVSTPGVVAGTLLVLGLPFFGLGVYALVTGRARLDEQGTATWLRPPIAYLTIGLALLLSAALAT